MKDIFISYNSSDLQWARWISYQLERNGYSTIFQERDFKVGNNFVLEMQGASIECAKTIAIITNNYLESLYTQSEWTAAFRKDPLGKGCVLLPVRVQNINVPGILGNIIYIDLVGLNEADAINKLITEISKSFKPSLPSLSNNSDCKSVPIYPNVISTNIGPRRVKLDIELDIPHDQFTHNMQERIFSVLCDAASSDGSNFRITGIRYGSIHISLETDEETSLLLLKACNSGSLAHIGLKKATIEGNVTNHKSLPFDSTSRKYQAKALLINEIRFKSIVFSNELFSRETILSYAATVSNYLVKSKVSESCFIVLFSYNHIKTFIFYLGIINSGHKCVLINPDIGRLELNEICEELTPAFIIKPDKSTIKLALELEIVVNSYQPTSFFGNLSDACLITYGGAYYGKMKPLLFTIDNLFSAQSLFSQFIVTNESSIACSFLLFSFSFGFITGLLLPALSQNSLLINSIYDFSSIRKTLEEIKQVGVTHIFTENLMSYFLTKFPEITSNFRNVKQFTSFCLSNKLSPVLIERLKDKLSCDITEGFVTPELGFSCTWILHRDNSKYDSLGRSFGNCQIGITSELLAEPALSNSSGEITIRGNCVMTPLLSSDNSATTFLHGNWLRTYQYGSIDGEGYLFRNPNKNPIKTLANNDYIVYPEEVKRLILKNPDIVAANIIPEKDEFGLDRLHAELQVKNLKLESEYIEWCYNNISKHKMPRSFSFYE